MIIRPSIIKKIRKGLVAGLAFLIVTVVILIFYSVFKDYAGPVRFVPEIFERPLAIRMWIALQVYLVPLTPFVIYMLLPIRSLITRILFGLFTTLYYLLEYTAVYFLLTRQVKFDYYYFWLNKSNLYTTLSNIYSNLPLVILAILAVVIVIIIALSIVKKFFNKSKSIINRTFF